MHRFIRYIRIVLHAGACPRCHSADITLSKSRRISDYVMRVFKLSPYRCRECRSRFYLPHSFGERIQAQSRWLNPPRRSRRSSGSGSASV